jgi:hypothetical protein
VIDRELIDQYKAEMPWVDPEIRYSGVTPEGYRPEPPSRQKRAVGNGICLNCQRIFRKMVEKQLYCSAKECQMVRQRKNSRETQQRRAVDGHEFTPSMQGSYRCSKCARSEEFHRRDA